MSEENTATEPSKAELDAAVKGAVAGDELGTEGTGTAVPGEAIPGQYSEIELEAIEHGWNPEGVEGRRTLTAEEFMDRQPLYDDLKKNKRQLRKQQEQIEALKKHMKVVDENARRRALEELKVQKREALENEDYDGVIAIDEQIAETKNAPVIDEAPTTAAFESWRESNEWYDEDPAMKDYADMVGTHYAQKNPNMPAEEVFNYVTNEVKTRFADKFKNVRREQPTQVEGAARGRVPASRRGHSVNDLPEEHRQIMQTLVRGGTMTKEEYLKSYFGDE